MSSSNLGYDSNPGGTKLVIVQLTFLGLAWIVGLLRAYVKIFLIKKVTLDDWLMLTALLGYTAYGIIAVHGVATGGTGRHTKELSLEGIAIALRAWYLCEVICMFPSATSFNRCGTGKAHRLSGFLEQAQPALGPDSR